MTKRKRITRETLRRLVREEQRRLDETLELGLSHPSEAPKRTREVDADKFANTLEQTIDYYKLCKLKEAKLIRDLKKIQEAKQKLKAQILNNI